MRQKERSVLEYAILGLLKLEPRSGYDIRKVFSTTLMGLYSDSPGTIYPALRRLTRDGFIEPAPAASDSGRRREPFRLTRMGKSRFENWVTGYLPRQELLRKPQAFSLQFAFVDGLLPKKEIIKRLEYYTEVFGGLGQDAETYRRENRDSLSETGYLILGEGAELSRSRVRWAKDAIRHLKSGKRKGGK